MYSINTWICIFIEFIHICLTFHTKNNHVLLRRVFHGMFSHKHDVHQEILEPGPLIQGYRGLLPLHVFKLLLLAAVSFMQINQFNSNVVPHGRRLSSEWMSFEPDFRKKTEDDHIWLSNEVNERLSLGLYCASSQGEMHLLDKGTQIFLRGLIISRYFWLNLDLLLLDVMGSQFLMKRQCIRY